MSRLLITGASGFVGRIAAARLAADGFTVIAAGSPEEPLDIPLDLRETSSVTRAVEKTRPDAVLHLAAQTFVPTAISEPLETYEINTIGTARLLETLRRQQRPIRCLVVSSAEVYGRIAASGVALAESMPLAPVNPYAASKAAAEMIALAARGQGVEVVIARPFNHIGPGQSPRFLVANVARQLMRIRAGAPPILALGNLDAERDMLDVRDVVRAYGHLLLAGADGATYNVCRGYAVVMREVVDRMIALTGLQVEIRLDPTRLRPNDTPRFVGNGTLLRSATGWAPQISLDESLRAILEDALRQAE